MIEKQKTKDGSRCLNDVEKMHQILLEMGYYKEEELESIDLNTAQIQEIQTFDCNKVVSFVIYVKAATPLIQQHFGYLFMTIFEKKISNLWNVQCHWYK